MKDIQPPKMAQGNQVPLGVHLMELKAAKERKNYHISIATLITTSIAAAAFIKSFFFI